MKLRSGDFFSASGRPTLRCCQVKDEAGNYLTGGRGWRGGGESVGCCLSVCLNDYAAVKRVSRRGCRVCRHSSHHRAEPARPGRHIIRTSRFSMTQWLLLLRRLLQVRLQHMNNRTESHWLLLKAPVFCKKKTTNQPKQTNRPKKKNPFCFSKLFCFAPLVVHFALVTAEVEE